ncbi:uracil-DNA glycosylase family protein [Lysobacter sp. CA196]|uniref:uracil-DNA glycosylase family protein n=1 Tax=Lysobacter sp. CA196 TaxID=3455606 RepID=UPI003F8D7144
MLLDAIRACTLCAPHLPHGPRPVVQADPRARLLIAGQAPGRKVHASGVPFDDASGERLRDWLGLDRATFYDEARVAIVPMGFCYPGKGRSGDLPPRPECATTWHRRLLPQLREVRLTLAIGRYAQLWHLPEAGTTLTEAVEAWRAHWPRIVALPHPSPRNQAWLKRHPWFAAELLPALRERIAELLSEAC